MPTMTDIEAAAKAFASARADLVERATALRDELEAVRRRHLRGLKGAVSATAAAQLTLANAIDGARELFERPRSVIHHGIKCGLQKGKDTVEWADSRRVAELVNEHLPEQRDVLVEVVYKPVVSALLQLDKEQLKLIGARRVPGKDSVLIKPVDDGVSKLIAALLKDAEDEVAEEAESA